MKSRQILLNTAQRENKMKSFAQYLTETRQTFDYRIKICGDITAEQVNELEAKLQQFDVIKMSEPKKTPIQKTLPDFPGVENESMSIIDVTFNYPTTPPQMIQIARLLGIDPNRMCVQDTQYADSIDEERAKYEAQADPLLGSDYEPNSSESQEASEYYGADPYKRKVVGNEYSSDFTIAGGADPDVFPSGPLYTTDYPNSTDSPIMGTNKIPKVTSSAGDSAPENRKDGPPGKNK